MEIREKIANCNKCGILPKLTKSFMQMGKVNLLIIGESPANDGWIKSGKAFYNVENKLQASGKVLEKLLNNINLSIKDIYFTELCKCTISDRSKLHECAQNCLPILKKQLYNINCDIILTMGLHPTQAMLNTKIKKFSDYVGKHFSISIDNKNFTLIPIYHPSPVNPKGYSGNLKIFLELKQYIKTMSK